jgi:hypothetical protein
MYSIDSAISESIRNGVLDRDKYIEVTSNVPTDEVFEYINREWAGAFGDQKRGQIHHFWGFDEFGNCLWSIGVEYEESYC